MATRSLDKNGLEDWYGNNAAVRCPICDQVFIVSRFLNKGQRQCPKCHKSTAQMAGEQVKIEWPDAEAV